MKICLQITIVRCSTKNPDITW